MAVKEPRKAKKARYDAITTQEANFAEGIKGGNQTEPYSVALLVYICHITQQPEGNQNQLRISITAGQYGIVLACRSQPITALKVA